MRKYSDKPIQCPYCKKREYFRILYPKKGDKQYLLTQCPKCLRYDDVRLLSTLELKNIITKEEQ